jgi:hypothetical protein
VAHRERQHVIHIAGDVGVEKDSRLFSEERRAEGKESEKQTAHEEVAKR